MKRRKVWTVVGILGGASIIAIALWASQPGPAYLIARNWALRSHQTGRPVDIPRLGAKLQAYLEIRPEQAEAEWRASTYFYLVDRIGATEADLRPFVDSPYAKIAELAQAQLRKTAATSKPVQLRFTALDGRVVDLERLRGKVVLLDFWASWCTPCLQELPNVKAVYDKYRDRGFEIIGISLDPAEDKQKLMDFLVKQEVTWPQHFAGEPDTNRNEVARRFGVRGVPSTFLLDRRGVASVSTIGVLGAELEPKLRELLEADTGA